MESEMGGSMRKARYAPEEASGGGKVKKSGDFDYKPEQEQWVSRVVRYSSQYDASRWCADQVIGPPKVYPRYGDISGSWASQQIDQYQFLELEFPEALFITELNIYETYHAGAIVSIKARNDTGEWVQLWKNENLQDIHHSRIFIPPIQIPTFRTRVIRLEIDCTVCNTWVEIDSVLMKGRLYQTEPPPSMSVLSDDLFTMVNSKQFSDVQFEVQGEIVYGHKVILTARSDYFRAMFNKESKSRESMSSSAIQLPDVSYESFIGVLQFLYSNQLPDFYTCVTLIDIWRAADRFSMEGLKTLITFLITEKLSEEDPVLVYVEATTKLPVLEEVKKSCLMFISGNMAKVSRSDSFTKLSQDVMLEIIQLTTAKLNLN